MRRAFPINYRLQSKCDQDQPSVEDNKTDMMMMMMTDFLSQNLEEHSANILN